MNLQIQFWFGISSKRNKNWKLKEQNLKLGNELIIVNKLINILEQEQFGKLVEIIANWCS